MGLACTMCAKAEANEASLSARLSSLKNASISSNEGTPSLSTIYPIRLAEEHASAIACIKRLPDGAHVCVSKKSVIGMWFDYMYVEEADRSAGVRVIYNEHYPPGHLDRGSLISFTGVMATADGQRVVISTSDYESDDLTDTAPISPLGMSSAAILGWPMPPWQPHAPRVQGLVPTGTLVKVWGTVSASTWADEEGYFLYLDDGWGKKDGSDIDAPGVRVYSNLTPGLGEFLVAIGVLSTRIVENPNPSGAGDDRIVIPVVRASYDRDPYYPDTEPVPQPVGQVWGRVRLVGQAAPGRSVRVYSQSGSVVLENVTNEFTSFTLPGVPAVGSPITASAPGYMSDSRVARSGDTDVDLVLQPSQSYVELKSDKESIAVCTEETATILAMLRDCEGKPLRNRQLRLTTNKGTFVATQTRSVVLTTDSTGFVEALLTAAPDGAGVASVVATTYPEAVSSQQTDVVLRGADIALTASPGFLTQSGTSLIRARVTDSEQAIPWAPIVFRTDHGTFKESNSKVYSAVANANGVAEANLEVKTAGTARILATYTNQCSQHAINWTIVSFKTAPWYSQGVHNANPMVVDLDGAPDGKKEVVVVTSTGSLLALSASGTVMWSETMHAPWTNTPSCITLDAGPSARPCVFVPAESQQKVLGVSHDGRALAGWPVGTNYRFLTVAASIADLNRDGSPEIVSGDESCYVFAWNPTGDWRKTGTWDSSYLWHNLTGSPSTTIFHTTCALGDIDDDEDGMLDVIVGSNHANAVFAFPGAVWGDFVSKPLYLDDYPKAAGGRVATSPAIGDIDGDGKNDVALGSDDGSIYIRLSSDGSWRGYPTGGPVKSSPALCDLDGDGRLDVIVGSDSGRVFAINWLGQAIDGWGRGIRLNSAGDYPVVSSPVVGDVTGDGEVNIVVGCSDGHVYALYKDGINHQIGGMPVGPVAWARCCIPPNDTTAAVTTSPVIDDVNNDGKVDVVVAGDKGIYLFQINVPYAQDPALYPWPTFHRDNQRTGCATPQPPPIKASIQGYVTKEGLPVVNARIYITHQDGTPVYQPWGDPPVVRGWVQTVGTATGNEPRSGAYCINQLEPDTIYRLKVEVPGQPDRIVPDVAVTTGLLRLDIAL